jgi:hypothetical protein
MNKRVVALFAAANTEALDQAFAAANAYKFVFSTESALSR